ncbi:uncharacterized protein LOC123201856 isoform X1 [Mangifera indica]|uniref:uncharacterized protein LOC123201856 isoform X1 n=1 Tax=Mangifera indica TaxID=29780 RepID=UPI001CFA1EFC|nr:uncharacterized protein LOC123201856 isoform X1 [Mangifera indica]XP_044473357.1 uncharacterized protein LOC123201856 isoform X1 [Mangifera indica]
MEKGPHVHEKFTNMKSQRVKVEEPFAPALQDEAAEVSNLHAEPKTDHVSVDGVLCFGKENPGKCLDMKDFTYGLEHGFRTNYGGLDSFNTPGEDDLKLEGLDGLLDDVDEVDDIHAAHDLSSVCEDFLLDFEFTEQVTKLDYVPIKGSHFGNSSSESHSPGLSGTCNVAIGISKLSTTIVPESECKNGSLAKLTSCELHNTIKSECECKVPIEDTEGPSSLDVLEYDELDNDDNCLLSSILSKCKKRAKSSALGNQVKRPRKPTQRYMEEFSDQKSKSLLDGQKVSATVLKDKRLKVISRNQSSNQCGNQVPSVSRSRGRCLKNCAPIMGFESDDDPDVSGSHDTCVRKKKTKVDVDRRKHQRMWTLSEVMKLIDGIAQYGVGRWTDIKRLLFPSSSHRTPIDLRDKWRNLLRASCVQKKNKGEVESKNVIRALPRSVLCQIRELATIHPYPRVCNSKISCDNNIASSKLSAKSKGARPRPSPCGHRKRHT